MKNLAWLSLLVSLAVGCANHPQSLVDDPFLQSGMPYSLLLQKQIPVENHVFPVRKQGNIKNIRFDQILKEMRSVRKLRHHATALVGHFDKHRRIADLVKADRNTQARRRRAPSARPKQNRRIWVLITCQAVQFSDQSGDIIFL